LTSFRILVQHILLLLSITGGFTHARATESITIYFYNPEINITRNALLKNTFDLYLENQGAYQFQPVDNKETFESVIKEKKNAIFMMSNWHYLQLKKTALLKTSTLVLRGIKNGHDTYNKILVAKQSTLNLNTMSLATSGNEEYSRSILSDIYSQESVDQFSSLNILTVPKDIDALMAVGFGLADAALTTKSSLDKLSTLYQQQNQALHIIGESHSLKRLAVVFKQIPQAEHRQIQFILRQMAKDKKGKRGLSMLGLDDWRLVDEHLTTNKGSGR
jgi:hypothetical protein